MTSRKVQRTLRMKQSELDEIRDVAKMNRTTVTNFVTDGLREFVDNPDLTNKDGHKNSSVTTTFMLDIDLIERIEAIAEERNMSVSEIIKMAVQRGVSKVKSSDT